MWKARFKRAIAPAACIKMVGQKLADYGFDVLKGDDKTILMTHAHCAFTSDADARRPTRSTKSFAKSRARTNSCRAFWGETTREATALPLVETGMRSTLAIGLCLLSAAEPEPTSPPRRTLRECGANWLSNSPTLSSRSALPPKRNCSPWASRRRTSPP